VAQTPNTCGLQPRSSELKPYQKNFGTSSGKVSATTPNYWQQDTWITVGMPSKMENWCSSYNQRTIKKQTNNENLCVM